MKTTCKPVPPKVKIVTLFSDSKGSHKLGTIALPEYEDQPRAIVFNDVIYMNDDRYSWDRDNYKAVQLVHVAHPHEFNMPEPEAPAEVYDEPLAPPSPRTVAQIDI